MKRVLAFIASYFIFGLTAYVFMKAGMYVSEEYFSGGTFPLVMITGAGCCIGYVLAITFMKGAGFDKDVE
ncbi:hypothetical protein [Pantoea sp. JV6]|uniref:hypothetical protein n=1 Tax=Pantoea sp. JV6 TaxID=2981604 RepID=UPI00221F04F2|nr:hypothetical protein [Pantoea sp. JV6]MCW0974377.1 hypothetical protein [Pantoea sp. JV6]